MTSATTLTKPSDPASQRATIEDVFKYLATDAYEQGCYRGIIHEIQRAANTLFENIHEPIMAEHYYNELMKYTKNLENLVLLRRLYISGVISDPHSAAGASTETKDPAAH